LSASSSNRVIDDRDYPVKCIEWWKKDGGMVTVAGALEGQDIFITMAIKKGRAFEAPPDSENGLKI